MRRYRECPKTLSGELPFGTVADLTRATGNKPKTWNKLRPTLRRSQLRREAERAARARKGEVTLKRP